MEEVRPQILPTKIQSNTIKMKYYTLEKAVMESEKIKKGFTREINMNFYYSSYNLLRLFLGYQPKVYYFKKENKK